ncbi:class F sortase [Ornithinimicrobium ciconiae]|uniref:Class F sortase n=1 Tax=Ornithinimicrobium ciconiae TaxID=2594265 RepID=A0A516GCN3_9MICO|nr:class F sortase [Ornithinimicrobium ciconiae]QDO89257.1 class F sortase [Ornithinimicrobium ciconiae]
MTAQPELPRVGNPCGDAAGPADGHQDISEPPDDWGLPEHGGPDGQRGDPAARPRPVRRPLSAERRALYRRRRIVAGILALLLMLLLVLVIQGAAALLTRLTGPSEAVAAPALLAAADSPVQLSVPAVGVSLPLTGTGVDDRGLINPPAGQAIWYAGHDRVAPGDLGTAVVAGRATGDDGEATPFAKVTSLTEGDRIVVTFGDGVTLELDVVSTALVARSDLESVEVLWDDQRETRRVALVTSDEVADADGDSRGSFLAVAELG